MSDDLKDRLWNADREAFKEAIEKAEQDEREALDLEHGPRRDAALATAYADQASAYYSQISSLAREGSAAARKEMRETPNGRKMSRDLLGAAGKFMDALDAFSAARHLAHLAADRLRDRKVLELCSDGTIDIVATILKLRWLWWRNSHLRLVERLLRTALSREDLAPHSRALLLTGMAEVEYKRRRISQTRILCQQALDLERDLHKENDQVQVHRQYSRVLRRVSELLFLLKEGKAAYIHKGALQLAHWYDTSDQVAKIEDSWELLRGPWYLRLIRPS